MASVAWLRRAGKRNDCENIFLVGRDTDALDKVAVEARPQGRCLPVRCC
jgi:hypothetical protein